MWIYAFFLGILCLLLGVYLRVSENLTANYLPSGVYYGRVVPQPMIYDEPPDVYDWRFAVSKHGHRYCWTLTVCEVGADWVACQGDAGKAWSAFGAWKKASAQMIDNGLPVSLFPIRPIHGPFKR